jgi:hypothetical protein
MLHNGNYLYLPSMNTIIPVKVDEWAKMVEATKVAADLMVENKRLKDENERLRKWGEKLAGCIESSDHLGCYYVSGWNAAKEGRDAK